MKYRYGNFELIQSDIEEIKIHDKLIPFNNNYKDYEKVGIRIRKSDNPNKLICFGDLKRFYNETNPALKSATAEEIQKHIPENLKK